MKTYIALLRGINVSGQKKIIMAELRTLLAKAGLQDVRTYIQSGNIAFNHIDSPDILTNTIHQTIWKKYNFEVPTIVLEQTFLTQVIQQNPFLKKNPNLDIKELYVTYLSEKPTTEKIQILQEKNQGDDELFLLEKVLYLRYKNGASHTKLTNKFIETHLKVSATSRNWKTTLKLENL